MTNLTLVLLPNKPMFLGKFCDIINDEARLANDLQHQYPGTTRTEALKEAKRLIELYGLDLTLQ
jgi:hypothetical protein